MQLDVGASWVVGMGNRNAEDARIPKNSRKTTPKKGVSGTAR